MLKKHFKGQDIQGIMTIIQFSVGLTSNGVSEMNVSMDKFIYIHHVYSHINIVIYLFLSIILSEGTQVNCQSFEGRSALLLATEQGHLEVVKQLISHGAQPNLCDDMDTYPLLLGMFRTIMDAVHKNKSCSYS